MKKNILFLVRHYNDLDNFSPLITELCQRKDSRIRILCVNPEFNIFSTHLYKYIHHDLGIPFDYSFSLIGSLKSSIATNLTGVLEKFPNAYFGRFLKWDYDIKCLSKYVDEYEISSVVVDERFLFEETGFPFLNLFRQILGTKGLKTYCFQTGQNPFNIEAFKSELKPEFYNFKTPIKIFFPYEIDRQRTVNDGLDQKIAFCRGSMRYSPAWISKLNSLLSKKTHPRTGNIKVLMLLTKLRYGVDKHLLIKIVEGMSQMEGIELTVKPHTRGMRAEFLGKSATRAHIDYETPTTSLIADCDLCLCMGTSMAAQVIIEGKLLGDLRCLQAEKNFFQEYKSAWIIDSFEELQSGLQLLREGKFLTPYGSKEVNDFLRFFIYGGADARDVTKEIADIILEG